MSYKQERQFTLLVSAAFLLAAFWPVWPLHAPKLNFLAAALAACVLLAAPKLVTPLLRVWLKFGEAIGWVTSKLVLAAVFFGLITPFAWVRRLSGHDPLVLRRYAATYWRRRDETLTPESMRNQY